MIKVLFLIPNLRGGGAERVLVNLCNRMDLQRFDVTVKTMFRGGVNQKFLNPSIRCVFKNAPVFPGISHVIGAIPPRLLYRYFIGREKYDVVVAFLHGSITRIASGCPDQSTKKIAWIHTHMENSVLWKSFATKKSMCRAFLKYDAIVGVAEPVSESFMEHTGIRDRVETIYNVNDIDWIHHMADDGPNPFPNTGKLRLISLGRLVDVKRFDRLIKIAHQLKEQGFEFTLHILGEGADRQKLESMIAEYGLAEEVFLPGFLKNPYPYIKNADLFICSSRHEGMSTVLSESVILGTPAISTDVSGAKEVLGAGDEYGIVTENSGAALYEGVHRLVADPSLLAHYKKQTELRSDFFSPEKNVQAVEELVERICGIAD